MEISNIHQVRNYSSIDLKEQNIVLEERKKEISGEVTASLNILPSKYTLSYNNFISSPRIMTPVGINITFSAEELKKYEIKDTKTIRRIREAMKKAEKIELKPGILIEIVDDIYIGLNEKGGLRVVLL